MIGQPLRLMIKIGSRASERPFESFSLVFNPMIAAL
jgi:hypothetical protein